MWRCNSPCFLDIFVDVHSCKGHALVYPLEHSLVRPLLHPLISRFHYTNSLILTLLLSLAHPAHTLCHPLPPPAATPPPAMVSFEYLQDLKKLQAAIARIEEACRPGCSAGTLHIATLQLQVHPFPHIHTFSSETHPFPHIHTLFLTDTPFSLLSSPFIHPFPLPSHASHTSPPLPSHTSPFFSSYTHPFPLSYTPSLPHTHIPSPPPHPHLAGAH